MGIANWTPLSTVDVQNREVEILKCFIINRLTNLIGEVAKPSSLESTSM